VATYGLWRAESPLNLAPFTTEAEALAAVRAAVDQHGATFVAGWSLVRIPRRGDWTTLAEGQQLVERALAASRPTNGRMRPARRPAVPP
jgi:hypothetical protein